MLELREVFDMVTKQTEPDLDSWKKQEDKQRRSARNRKIGAVAVAVAAVVVIGLFALASKPEPNHVTVTNPPSTVPFNTTPPIGVQFVAPDGTAVRQFPGNHDGDTSFQLSPDGSVLAYMNDGFVHTVSVDGTNDQTLTANGNTNSGDAMDHVSWTVDGSELVYAYSHNIYVMNADGSGQRQITHAPGGLGDFYPVVSPDGSTIAYWEGSPTGQDGGPDDAEIYTVPLTGGSPTRLTHNMYSNIEPAWSPDGTKIAYWDGGDLFVMRADGRDQHRVASVGGSWAPAWSPDGKQIAFVFYTGRHAPGDGSPIMQLRTVDLSTGKVTELDVHSLTDGNGPQWVSHGEILINRYN